jgi:ubiquinone biosynthesis protein
MLHLGILHADPHPGNLLVQPGPRLVLLDHGLTVSLAPSLVNSLNKLVQALTRRRFRRSP